MQIKCVVLASNSNGEPEFHTCEITCTQEQYDEGEHYELAMENAEFNGYEKPMLAFDANDQAAKEMGEVWKWI